MLNSQSNEATIQLSTILFHNHHPTFMILFKLYNFCNIYILVLEKRKNIFLRLSKRHNNAFSFLVEWLNSRVVLARHHHSGAKACWTHYLIYRCKHNQSRQWKDDHIKKQERLLVLMSFLLLVKQKRNKSALRAVYLWIQLLMTKLNK